MTDIISSIEIHGSTSTIHSFAYHSGHLHVRQSNDEPVLLVCGKIGTEICGYLSIKVEYYSVHAALYVIVTPSPSILFQR